MAKLQSLDPHTPMFAQFREKTGPIVLANTFFVPKERTESSRSTSDNSPGSTKLTKTRKEKNNVAEEDQHRPGRRLHPLHPLVRDGVHPEPGYHGADLRPADWPSGDGGGFLIVKGIRDVVMALVLAILLSKVPGPRPGHLGACRHRRRA
jgi:hypothetical protein